MRRSSLLSDQKNNNQETSTRRNSLPANFVPNTPSNTQENTRLNIGAHLNPEDRATYNAQIGMGGIDFDNTAEEAAAVRSLQERRSSSASNALPEEEVAIEGFPPLATNVINATGQVMNNASQQQRG